MHAQLLVQAECPSPPQSAFGNVSSFRLRVAQQCITYTQSHKLARQCHLKIASSPRLGVFCPGAYRHTRRRITTRGVCVLAYVRTCVSTGERLEMCATCDGNNWLQWTNKHTRARRDLSIMRRPSRGKIVFPSNHVLEGVPWPLTAFSFEGGGGWTSN